MKFHLSRFMRAGREIVHEYFSVDLRSIALLRIGVALLVLWDLAHRATDLAIFYSDAGVVPRSFPSVFGQPLPIWVHFLNGRWEFQSLLFTIAGICAVALLVGYRTKLATILSCYFLLSLQMRNGLILQNGDVLLRAMLLWGIFLPWRARFSFDSRGEKERKVRTNAFFSVGTAGYVLQIVVLYVFSALHKTGWHWQHGTAVYYALNLDQFVSPLGIATLTLPLFVLIVLSHTVRWVELFAPVFFFAPRWTTQARFLGIGLLAALQIGFGLSLRLGLFPLIGIVSLWGMLPRQFWDWRRRVAHRSRVSEGTDVTTESSVSSNFWERSRIANGIAGVVLLVVLAGNVVTLPSIASRVPLLLYRLGWQTGLFQRWSMFSPNVPTNDGWPVVAGWFRDGSVVDLFRGGSPLDWSKPERVTKIFPTFRWQKYVEELVRYHGEGEDRPLLYYAEYLCSNWNAVHHGGKILEKLAIFYMLEKTKPEFQPPTLEKRQLFIYVCLESNTRAGISGNPRPSTRGSGGPPRFL